MPYVARTQEEILAELQNWSALPSSLVEGTFAYDILASNAVEFQKISLEIAELYNNAFGHTASNEYLELKAAEAGVGRRAANFAVGKVTVTGNGTINEGAIFSTAANTRFLANETVEVDGSAEVDIIAEKAGSAGNVAAGTITKIPMSIAGIRTVTNSEPTIDGFDEESDEELRERYLSKVRNPGVSGNPREYIEWATSVVGVGAARCQRCWNGAGTVKVVVADSNLEAANVLLLQRVYDYIQQERPVGAEVTVVSAEIIPINISAKITGTLDVEKFKISASNYFKKMTRETLFSVSNGGTIEQFGGATYISLAQINSLLINAGADDVQHLTLNGVDENFQLNIDQIPSVGELNFYP